MQVDPPAPLIPVPPRAAKLAADANIANNPNDASLLYWDRSNYTDPQEQLQALRTSSTVYIGNLSFSTRTTQLRQHFSQVVSTGNRLVKVIPGLDKYKHTPCGFAFGVYSNRKDALAAVQYLSGTFLDGNAIRVELDGGFVRGREFGRGKSGGQIRDERRNRNTDDSKRRREQIVYSNFLNQPQQDDGLDRELNAKRQRRDE